MTTAEFRIAMRKRYELARRRDNRVAYYYMARGQWSVARDHRALHCALRAIRLMLWFWVMTLVTWIARRELDWYPKSGRRSSRA